MERLTVVTKVPSAEGSKYLIITAEGESTSWRKKVTSIRVLALSPEERDQLEQGTTITELLSRPSSLDVTKA